MAPTRAWQRRLRASPNTSQNRPQQDFERAYIFSAGLSECAILVRPCRQDHGERPMLYALLCYHDEALVSSWTREQDDAVLAKRAQVTDALMEKGKLGP